MKIDKLIRNNIKSLLPYSSARDEYKGKDGIFLDANENPFGKLNRYPDPYQNKLKTKLSQIKKISIDNIFIGNGSDEVIDLAMRIFCEPGKDSIIILPPTYGMYEVSAKINNIDVITIPLTSSFQPDLNKIKKIKNAKILFICSPNNPTGNSIENIEAIVKGFDGIVFIDEAYIDFCPQKSFLNKLNKYNNVIISQTLSKAYGLAGARIGIAYSSQEVISYFNKIKPPYNVSALNQKTALKTLDNQSRTKKKISIILNEKGKLIKELKSINGIRKIYPSDANFLLVKINSATKIYNKLIRDKIIVRNRSSVISDTLRISIGTPKENKTLINTLKKLNK